ncbi:hypothetical protein SN11_20480 [Vibrio harveyi]|nr:hypothetical protein SN11_20480 [Vibrio harveyi]
MNYKLFLLMAAMSSANVLADGPPGSDIIDLYLHAGNGQQTTRIYANGHMSALVKVYYELAEGVELQSIELRLDGMPGGEELPSSWKVTDYNPNPELPTDISGIMLSDAKETLVKYKYLTTKNISQTSICAKITTSNGSSADTCDEGGNNRVVSVISESPITYSISSWDVSERVSVNHWIFTRDYQTFTPRSFNIKKVIMDGAKPVSVNITEKKSDSLFYYFKCNVPNAYVNNENIQGSYTLSLYVYKPEVSNTSKTCYYDYEDYYSNYNPPSFGCQDCTGSTSHTYEHYNPDFNFPTNNSITFLTTRNNEGSIDVRPYRGDVSSGNKVIVWDTYGNEAVLMPTQTDITIDNNTYPGYLIN